MMRPPRPDDQPAPITAREVAAWLLLYFLLGAASLHFLREAISSVIPVWLPCGIGVALQLRANSRQRIPIAIAQMLVEFSIEELFGVLTDVRLHVWYAVAVAIEAWLIGALIRRFNEGRSPRLSTLRELRAFVGGATLGTLIGGTIAGLGEVALLKDTWVEAIGAWVQSDLSGVVVLAPLAFATDALELRRLRERWVSAVAMLVVLVLCVILLYGSHLQPRSPLIGIGFLIFPPLIFGALGFGLAGAAAGSVLLSIVIGLLTELGFGPIAALGYDQFTRQLVSQGFVALMAVSALTVGVLIRSQWNSNENLLAARAAAEEAAARFRSFFEGTPEMLAVVDRNGSVVLANRLWTDAFAREGEVVVGQPLDGLAAIIGDRFGSRFTDVIGWWRDALDGQRIVRPWEARGADGVTRELEMSLAPLHDDQQRVVGAYMSVRDVGELRARQAEEARARRLETVGRLAGGVAHDFNNIVTGIQGYVHLLADALPVGHPSRSDLDEIRRAGDRAAALTRQLLAYARRQVIEPRSTTVPDLLQGIAGLLQRLIGEDVALQMRPHAELWPVRVDPGQLEQVIMNLAVNARDAMPAGGSLTIECANTVVDVTEAARREIAPGEYVLIAVSDTGVGMSADVLERLFEPFFTTKGPGHGTGLGLATVEGIVRQVGGAIEARSEIGRGTTFRVLLPRDVAAPTPAAPHPVAAVPQPRGHEHLLLVEDDAALRGLVARVLRNAGYTVDAFADGESMVEIGDADLARASLAVCDLVLPGMNGRQVAERLGQRAPHLRVLYVSGYTEDDVMRHGIKDGAVNFLAKPFDTEELTAKVRAVLDA